MHCMYSTYVHVKGGHVVISQHGGQCEKGEEGDSYRVTLYSVHNEDGHMM